MTKPKKTSRLYDVSVTIGMVLLTLVGLEIFLRVANFKEFREEMTERSLGYSYDSEIGWMPVPNSTGVIKTFRTTQYKHNSIGLRDEEFTLDSKPAIMFLGDSFVWGLDSQADERFTELLKPKLPDYKIVPAGVSGYGTDQEYLLLKRIWPKIKPEVVVLIFCAANDRLDNSTNIRYEDYQKPYFAPQPDGTLKPMNQPVPRSQILYIVEDKLVRNLWLARMATNVYVRLRYPRLTVPDPTEKVVGMIRDFVVANGAKFMVGIQHHDEAMTRYLAANNIPVVQLGGADYYTQGGWGPHWTPEGQQDVANRVLGMLNANGIGRAAAPAQK
jgi:hypothetical protein